MEPLVFPVSQLHRPSIYTPLQIEDAHPQYGAMIVHNEAPAALMDHLEDAKWVTALSTHVFRLWGGKPPAVISDKPLDTILSCTRAANLNPDLLFVGLPLLISVQPYVMDSTRVGKRNKAAIMAVKVSHADMLRRYDEICAGFFADPSHPAR